MSKYYRFSIVSLLLIMIIQATVAEAVTRKVCRSGCTYSSIQAAIDASEDGDSVLVFRGTYYENIHFKGKAIVVRSEKGAKKTIIDGRASGSVVTFEPTEESNSVLDGFTITGGSGFDLWKNKNTYGGGIYCNKSSPIIKNCIIRDNVVTQAGGGIYIRSSSPVIVNCIIRHNSAEMHGGGISCAESSLLITGSTLTDNRANFGGAIACGNTTSSSVTIENCNIDGNDFHGITGGAGNAEVLR